MREFRNRRRGKEAANGNRRRESRLDARERLHREQRIPAELEEIAVHADPIHAEHKYGKQFDFRPFATFVFAANEAPISSDRPTPRSASCTEETWVSTSAQ